MLPNTQKITSEIALMPDMALKQMAMMHKNDPYVLPLIISEDARRKEMRQAAQARVAGMAQPKVNDAAVAQIGALPEQQGIGTLPAQNLAHMADGGIAGYATVGNDGNAAPNPASGPAGQLAFNNEPVMRMAGGGIAHFAKGGGLNEYADYIRETATKYGMDPDMAMRLFKTESGGDRYAESGKGAVGLGQLLPGTAKEMGLDPSERTDPHKNINASIGYFMKQMDKYKDPAKAAAAYNWGGGNLDKHLAKNKGELNPAGLPKETANYLTKLMPGSVANASDLPKNEWEDNTQKTSGLPSLQNKNKLENLDTAGTFLGLSQVPAALVPAAVEAFSAKMVPGLIRSAGVATAIPAIGGQLTDKAMQDLQSLPANRRAEMANNPMLSALSGDVGLAAAIQDAAANNPEGPSTMPYGEQMKKALSTIPSVITSAPSSYKGIPLGLNKDTAKNLVRPLNEPLQTSKEEPAAEDRTITRDDDMSPNGEIKQGIPDSAKDAFMEAAKAELSPKKAKGMSDDDLVAFGLGLMASKNPNALGAAGEAGLGALAMKREQQKTEREDLYRQALAREANAKAATYESGSSATNQALAQADRMYDNWRQSLSKFDAMQLTPEMQKQKQEEFLLKSFQMFKIAPPPGVGGGTAVAGTQLDPLGLRKSQKVKYEHQ